MLVGDQEELHELKAGTLEDPASLSQISLEKGLTKRKMITVFLFENSTIFCNCISMRILWGTASIPVVNQRQHNKQWPEELRIVKQEGDKFRKVVVQPTLGSGDETQFCSQPENIWKTRQVVGHGQQIMCQGTSVPGSFNTHYLPYCSPRTCLYYSNIIDEEHHA